MSSIIDSGVKQLEEEAFPQIRRNHQRVWAARDTEKDVITVITEFNLGVDAMGCEVLLQQVATHHRSHLQSSDH